MSAPPALDQMGVPLLVSADDGACLEGVIVGGQREEDGAWDLDSQFVLLTDEGERFRVNGWCCTIEATDASKGSE